ncbi:MAG: DUF1080 domain-containing protein [Pirellulales bacterium]
MFDGKTLDGWVVEGTKDFLDKAKTKTPVWTVTEQGTIRCAGNGFGFLRFDKQEVADFCYHVEFKTSKGCNSGVGIRHLKFNGKAETRPSFSGYEIQVLDDAGKKPDVHGTASLYRYVAPTSNPVKPAGEWNVMEIECRGPKIKITLNDVVVQDVDQSKVKDIQDKPLKGYVSVQNHGKEIEFKNLRLKPLVP